jgi:uncharacterized membrane protein YdfJ with MMPL/SSD domain
VLERLTRRVLGARTLVLVLWAGTAATGLLLTPHLTPLLANSLTVPGSDSDRAQRILAESFGERPDGTFTVVFPTDHPAGTAVGRAAARHLALAAAAVDGGVARQVRRGVGIVYGDVVTPLSLEQAKGSTDRIRGALAAPGAPPALVTGAPALQHDVDPIVAHDLRRAELVAVPIALLVLLLALGVSGAVLIPFVFAAATIGTTLAALYVAAHVFLMTAYVENLVVLVGFALAVDYALLCVDRFRVELSRGGSPDDAVLRTMATTGRAVAYSGAAVAVGLAALLLIPVPLIRSMGVGGALVPLVSIAALLTLQPVLLSLLGNRVLVRGAFHRRAIDHATGRWAGYGRWLVRHRAVAVALGSATLVALALPVTQAHVTPGSISVIPGASEAVRGARLLTDGVGPGAVTPIQVVVDTGDLKGGAAGPARRALARLTDALVADPEAYVVANGVRPPYVAANGRVGRVVVAPRHEYGEVRTRTFVGRIREDLIPAAGLPAGARAATGGAPAQGVDFLDRLYGWFPFLVVLVLAATYVVLLRAFRSALVPLQAVLLNLVSVAAGLGAVVVVVQWGIGAELLGVSQADGIEGWVPVVVFALLFGLSMDYEVFLVMPMREAIDLGAAPDPAVVDGLARTGPIVTAAATIMVAVFGGFVAGSVPGLQQFGLALAVGILVDATLVRLILVPGTISLLGRRAWWLPASRGL